MATNPSRRRHSPAVYRRRRLMVLLVIAVVVAVVWLLIAQPWRGAAAERTGATPTPTDTSAIEIPTPDTGDPTPVVTESGPTPEPTTPPEPMVAPEPTVGPDGQATPSATPVAVGCKANDLLVEALTDLDTYAADQSPQFSIRLTNQSATDCTLNVGTSAQVFTVTSGSDTWWRSTDCQSEPSDMVVLLTAGQTVTSAAPLLWDRTRSSVDSCDSTDRPNAATNGASYHLAVSIGGVPATQTAFFMLS